MMKSTNYGLACVSSVSTDLEPLGTELLQFVIDIVTADCENEVPNKRLRRGSVPFTPVSFVSPKIRF